MQHMEKPPRTEVDPEQYSALALDSLYVLAKAARDSRAKALAMDPAFVEAQMRMAGWHLKIRPFSEGNRFMRRILDLNKEVSKLADSNLDAASRRKLSEKLLLQVWGLRAMDKMYDLGKPYGAKHEGMCLELWRNMLYECVQKIAEEDGIAVVFDRDDLKMLEEIEEAMANLVSENARLSKEWSQHEVVERKNPFGAVAYLTKAAQAREVLLFVADLKRYIKENHQLT
ncbi:MAG: hypothetical protein WC641_07275 [Patescibacteria group bacterium]